ncbi:MAG: hypothetical protein D3911_16010 [Candidatus Electrothrix sp. AW3_4]|nr:hypothetical protein [Candidatus Electrothrix gigas]
MMLDEEGQNAACAVFRNSKKINLSPFFPDNYSIVLHVLEKFKRKGAGLFLVARRWVKSIHLVARGG